MTIDVLKTLITNLNFRSESDCEWQVFAPAQKRTYKPTWLTMQNITGRLVLDTPDFDVWFEHAIASQPQSRQYVKLREGLSKLSNVQVFKMTGFDNFNISYFIVGLDDKNNLVGVSCGAVET